MTPTERHRGTRVELYGRETLPPPAAERRDHVAETLRALERQELIDECTVSAWPKRIECASAADPDARDLYLSFQSWAEDNQVRLTPFFQTRECYSMETGDRGDWVVFPAICLAVYEGDDLVSVYPHADGDTYRSVLTGLESLVDDDDSDEDRDRIVAGPAD